jgi:biotin transport system substrate-specific component
MMSQALPNPAARSTIALAVARETTAVLGVAVALAAASRVAFPLGFTPVPVTAQTFVVLLAGVLVGGRRAGSGALAYPPSPRFAAISRVAVERFSV